MGNQIIILWNQMKNLSPSNTLLICTCNLHHIHVCFHRKLQVILALAMNVDSCMCHHVVNVYRVGISTVSNIIYMTQDRFLVGGVDPRGNTNLMDESTFSCFKVCVYIWVQGGGLNHFQNMVKPRLTTNDNIADASGQLACGWF